MYSLILSALGAVLVLAFLDGGRPDGRTAAQWAWGGLQLWGAAASLTLAAAYFLKERGRSPESILDSAAARAAWAVIGAPYTALAILSLGLTRLLSQETHADEISPGIWVGGAPLFGDRAEVLSRGATAVLNMCCELGDLAGLSGAPGILYRRIPILDGIAPTLDQLREAVDWAAARRAEGRPLLIHCAQGHGRSATVAAGLLIRLGLEKDVEGAVGRLVRARPGIRLHAGHRAVCAKMLK